MNEVLLLLSLILTQWSISIVIGEESNITFPILNGTIVKNFNKTTLLRYGHQQTNKCQDFQKAYVCIMMCLERGYDIAYADKTCMCTCVKDKTKAKYFSKVTDWKIPTSSKPAWAAGDPAKGILIGGEYVDTSAEVDDKTHATTQGVINGTTQFGNQSNTSASAGSDDESSESGNEGVQSEDSSKGNQTENSSKGNQTEDSSKGNQTEDSSNGSQTDDGETEPVD